MLTCRLAPAPTPGLSLAPGAAGRGRVSKHNSTQLGTSDSPGKQQSFSLVKCHHTGKSHNTDWGGARLGRGGDVLTGGTRLPWHGGGQGDSDGVGVGSEAAVRDGSSSSSMSHGGCCSEVWPASVAVRPVSTPSLQLLVCDVWSCSARLSLCKPHSPHCGTVAGGGGGLRGGAVAVKCRRWRRRRRGVFAQRKSCIEKRVSLI